MLTQRRYSFAPPAAAAAACADTASSCSAALPADALKFNGPAPELINSRLAMVGLIEGACAEAETGNMALYQLTHPTFEAVAVVLLFILATLIPVTKGAKMEAFGEC